MSDHGEEYHDSPVTYEEGPALREHFDVKVAALLNRHQSQNQSAENPPGAFESRPASPISVADSPKTPRASWADEVEQVDRQLENVAESIATESIPPTPPLPPQPTIANFQVRKKTGEEPDGWIYILGELNDKLTLVNQRLDALEASNKKLHEENYKLNVELANTRKHAVAAAASADAAAARAELVDKEFLNVLKTAAEEIKKSGNQELIKKHQANFEKVEKALEKTESEDVARRNLTPPKKTFVSSIIYPEDY